MTTSTQPMNVRPITKKRQAELMKIAKNLQKEPVAKGIILKSRFHTAFTREEFDLLKEYVRA
jgi:hypothetical protein